jgi:2-amino-4-hydroxy-6-hydroxymethyldihydropteridine diphosphokinase / dihydropteroate synthase
MSYPTDPTRKTQVMAVLNITPDSFSDGGKHNVTNLEEIERTVRNFIADGVTIIDVGGQSTRPGATKISSQQELERVRPVIERIRSIPEARDVAISVDTFYADVARGAVAAGADIINDVSSGVFDPQMLPLAAELGVTIILMHMRGTPETMAHLTEYPEGVINGVGKELGQRVTEALRAGVPRWRIVLDPGIGFAKTENQNLELLRDLDNLRRFPGLENFPWLVGTSRKGFIGKITGVSSAVERGWGTAATVTTSVAGGADIVRVHDIPEMVQVTKMADTMYRSVSKPWTPHNAAPMTGAANTELDAYGEDAAAPIAVENSSWVLSPQFTAGIAYARESFLDGSAPRESSRVDSDAEDLNK